MAGKQTKTSAKSASSGANRQDKGQVAQVVGGVSGQLSDNLTHLQPQNLSVNNYLPHSNTPSEVQQNNHMYYQNLNQNCALPTQPAPLAPATPCTSDMRGQNIQNVNNACNYQNNGNTYQNMHATMPSNQWTPGTPTGRPGFNPPTYQQHVQNSGAYTDTATQMLIAMVQKMDTRLQSIESSVSKIDSIKSEMSQIKAEVSNLRQDNTDVKSAVKELETFRHSISDFIDECVSHTKSCTQTSKEIKISQSHLCEQIQHLQTRNDSQNEEILDLKWRSMRDNLVFVGIPENYLNDTEQTETSPSHNAQEQTLRKFLTQYIENDVNINTDNKVKVENIKFHRVHRSGGPARPGKPRNIIAKFERYTDREMIREAGLKLNRKRSGLYINEQFPPEIEDRRRKLFPVLKRYRSDPSTGVKCKLVRDKLYVGNKLYDPNTDSLKVPPRHWATDNYAYNVKPFEPKKRPANDARPGYRKTIGALDFTTPNRFATLDDRTNDNPVAKSKTLFRSPPTPLDEIDPKRLRDNEPESSATAYPAAPQPDSGDVHEDRMDTAANSE